MNERIYTGRGDDGTTSLGSGARVRKTHRRVRAYGSADEACCAVGLARAATSGRMREILGFLQQKLYNCAGALASGVQQTVPAVLSEDVTALERVIDELMPAAPLGGFVLPAGADAAARLHLARAVVRRAERDVLELADAEEVAPEVLAFLNRASDVLFAAALLEQQAEGGPEMWDPAAEPDF